METYAEQHRRSLEDPEGFWGEAAKAIEWAVAPQVVLDRSAQPVPRWFVDGELNTCHNAVDRHVAAGRGGDVALVYDSPLAGVVQRFTFAELQDLVARAAGALKALGVERGDRVVIFMPMVPQVVVAMLACARLGAVHSVVFGGFAGPELAARIDDAQPKVIVAASCGLEPGRVVDYGALLHDALARSTHQPERTLLLQRPEGPVTPGPGSVDWDEAMAAAEPAACVPVKATDPLYILYTSGTTGHPKGIVRDNGGHAVALRWSMEHVYDAHPGEVFWAASDVGWVVGHSYIVYGPLLNGCTTILYEGKPVGTPDAGAFWRVAADHGVATLFAAPTAFRAIRRDDPTAALAEAHDLSKLRALFLAGERLDPPTYHWLAERFQRPVIDHWWQTETGWAIAANPLGIEPLPVKPGSPTVPMPGYDVRVLGPDHEPVPEGTDGDVVLRLPLPPGTLPTLWHDEERFVASYLARHPGHYLSGDGGHLDADGYLFVMGRTDDVINVAGHRLSTGVMEEVIAAHPAVAECAVVGVDDALKGEVPRAFVVLKAGVSTPHEQLEQEVRDAIRASIGPVAALKQVDVVAKLPKTRSGKVLRGTMRSICNGHDPAVPATIEDAAVLDDLKAVLRA